MMLLGGISNNYEQFQHPPHLQGNIRIGPFLWNERLLRSMNENTADCTCKIEPYFLRWTLFSNLKLISMQRNKSFKKQFQDMAKTHRSILLNLITRLFKVHNTTFWRRSGNLHAVGSCLFTLTSLKLFLNSTIRSFGIEIAFLYTPIYLWSIEIHLRNTLWLSIAIHQTNTWQL